MTVSRRSFETCVALLLGVMPVILLTFVFDRQVPTSGSAEISARIYPDTLAYVWLALTMLYLVDEWLIDRSETRELRKAAALRSTGIVGVVLVGFLLLVHVGYFAGSAFYILCFTWMMRERGFAAWLTAIITPVVVYLILNHAFGVRLPSFLD